MSGLATGCYAQMNGYHSHIFEHHSQPGGVAAAWRRGEYLIDGGIHFVMGHKPGTRLYDLYQQLGVVPANRFVDLTTYGRFTHEASGKRIEVTQDLDRLGHDLGALFPSDAKTVTELIAGTRALQGLDMSEMGLSRPPELMGLVDQIRDLWSMRHLLRFAVGKFGRSVADYGREIHDPVLRTLLDNLFLPEAPVYFVLMVLALLADGQLGLLEGGSRAFVQAIEERYRMLGGQVTYRATVEEILVENNRAVGVRLHDGREHRADAVVSAADGYSTIFRMLGGRYVSDKIRERYATWPRFRPLMLVNFGVAQEFPDEPAFASIVLAQPIAIGQELVDTLFVRVFNYSRQFSPPGKTVVQVLLETEWAFWRDLQQSDRARYDAEKQQVASEILQRLEAHYPGISGQVEVTDVCTPYTFWRYTLNDGGTWEGWLITPETMRTLVERTLPGLAGFAMAGQWVMPGGGVPPCLYSGRHAVQLLCRQDGKPFSTAST